MPVKETIKMAHSDGTVLKTLDRESLWQIQTPQTFQAHLIKEAFHKAAEDGFIGTDDASLVERIGVKVHILPGSYTNIKDYNDRRPDAGPSLPLGFESHRQGEGSYRTRSNGPRGDR